MERILVTAPSVEPLSLEEAKAHLRLEIADEDALVTRLIRMAREQAEQFTDRPLITQTWDLLLDGFGSGPLSLPLPPIQAVEAVTYLDTAGVEQTLAGSAYRFLRGEPARVTPASSTTWPTTLAGEQTVTVRIRCGYGNAGTNVPAPILQWMLMQVATWFEHRELLTTGTIVSDMDAAAGFLGDYRFRTVF